jgi:uncharacterized protein
MERAEVMNSHARDAVDTRASILISGVYLQMTAGVLLTGLVAYALMLTGIMELIAFQGGRAAMWGVIILQFGTVMMFRPLAASRSAGKLKGLFFFYAAITGVTVGYVSLVYTLSSILNVFLAASLAFSGLAMFGHVTKRNLGVVGTFCLQALWMVIGMSVIQAIASFFPSLSGFVPAWNTMTGLLGVVVFSGLTAYESQLVRQSAYSLAGQRAGETEVSIYTTASALTMYLNFVNLFFSLLRLSGSRR